MKRKRLLFAAIALVAGALNINAQEEDYTSHLQNADMSSTTGWTMVSKWNGPEGQTGYMCLESYAGWGGLDIKNYSLTQTITLPSGKYRAESNAFYRYGLTWNVDPSKSYAYFIATTPEANFKQIIPTLGNATDGAKRVIDGYANNMVQASQEFAAGNYKSTIEFALESESEVTFGYEGTHVLKQSWFISGPIKLYRVGNFDFSAWDTQIANAVEAINGKTLPTNAQTYVNGVVTQYNKTYESVAAYNGAIDALNALADAVDALATAYDAAKASYAIPPVAANTLATAVTAADEATYASIEDLNSQAESLNGAVAVANALVEPYAAWQTAKANAPGVLEEFVSGLDANVEAATTAEEINSAIDALNSKIAELEALQEVVEEYTVMKEFAQNLYNVAEYTENEDGAHDALGTAITDNSGTFTTPDEYTAATAALKAAATTYAAKADPKGDAKFDLTFMLTNPDVTEYWDGTWHVQPDGWYEDQNIDGDNFQVMANGNMGLNGEVFMEYWFWNAATSGFVLYQKVTLPEGAYQMTGRLAVNFDNVENATVANVTFSANDVDGTQIAAGTLQDASVEFINSMEQEVKIGMKAHEGNQARWMAINKIHLYKIAPKAFVINENEDYDYTQSGAGDVKLTRTIKEGMNSVVLPFQLTAEDIVTLGGEGAVAYTVTDYANDNLKLAEATTILANTPFFLKVVNLQNTNLFEFTDKTIVAGQPSVTVGDATLVGTYAKIDAVPEGSYILSGGKFYLVNSAVSLKPTRAYITIAEPTEVSALGFSFEDATAIVGVESETVNGEVYDIAGRKVSAPVRGLYIANGKKVLVK